MSDQPEPAPGTEAGGRGVGGEMEVGRDVVDEMRRKYSMIFDRLDRYTPDERAEVAVALLNQWCAGCGRPLGECLDSPDGCCCGVPTREIVAQQCAKCETIHWQTVRPATRSEPAPPATPTPSPPRTEPNP